MDELFGDSEVSGYLSDYHVVFTALASVSNGMGNFSDPRYRVMGFFDALTGEEQEAVVSLVLMGCTGNLLVLGNYTVKVGYLWSRAG